ncbi:gatA, partial [Symbiodinium pilosum]
AKRQKYKPSVDFPPPDCRKGEKLKRWCEKVFAAVPMKKPQALTPREKELLKLSAEEYVAERKSGKVTCEEYTSLLVKRAKHYRYMNQWIFRSYDLLDIAVKRARALDRKAAKEGVDALAPLYGLPIPQKGTAAVVDFPSGCGVGILSQYTPVKNSELTDLIYKRNGIIFGTSNVPEFACSVNTTNPASGQVRNPHNHAFSPGGSSGGAGSLVSMHMCPVAVSEDTTGSTRVPALFNGVFGFDPARNHYPNEGNCGMSFTRDQIGVVSRSMKDILFYDRALMQERHDAESLHISAEKAARERDLKSIVIACPEVPFQLSKDRNRKLDDIMRKPFEACKAALKALTVKDVGWPESSESATGVLPLELKHETLNWPFHTFTGQIAHFVFEYLDAPVSLKEIAEDTAFCGEHVPGRFYSIPPCKSETDYRYIVGPNIKDQVMRYNSLFDAEGVDLILAPAAFNATPDLSQALTRTTPAVDAEGKPALSGMWETVYPINEVLKDIQIPKLSVPTGVTEDGRPTGIQLWGRAVDYEDMFKEECATRRSVDFLHLASRVVEILHADPALNRVTPAIAADLFS